MFIPENMFICVVCFFLQKGHLMNSHLFMVSKTFFFWCHSIYRDSPFIHPPTNNMFTLGPFVLSYIVDYGDNRFTAYLLQIFECFRQYVMNMEIINKHI